jgi:hypothetical protein
MKPGRATLFAAAGAALLAGAVGGAPKGGPTPRPGPAPLPPIFLNHVYRVLDTETFEAIDRSEYLRTRFAQFERRTTSAGDDSWTGLYFYGKHTYFEVLAADAGRNRPVGACGIALGVEEPGGSDAVRSALDRVEKGARSLPRSRETAGRLIPWFRMTGLPPSDPGLSLFVLEYDPRFLHRWHPDVAPGLSGISRQSVLERYRAQAAPAFPPQDPLLEDVTEVALVLPAEDAKSFGYQLAALGYRGEPRGPRTDWIGPGVRFRVDPANGDVRGVAALEMSLVRRPAEDRTIELGPRARLEIRRDGTARMSFSLRAFRGAPAARGKG